MQNTEYLKLHLKGISEVSVKVKKKNSKFNEQYKKITKKMI